MNALLETHRSGPIEIRWIASLAGTAMHAAQALAEGQAMVEPRLADSFTDAARLLRQYVAAYGSLSPRIWQELCGLASDVENNENLAELALRKATGDSTSIDVANVSTAVGQCEASLRSEIPDVVDELAIRARPIREQFEARGPGILSAVAEWTDARVIPSQAEIVLVHPVMGGGGRAFLNYNRIHFEAVLANPHDSLPEVVRVAWLLAQLNLDIPVLGEGVPLDRMPWVAQLAMLPATLQAAESVELAAYSPESVRLAIRAWHIVTPPGIDPVDVVIDWWATYLETRPRWNVALTALNRMLG